MYLAVADRPTPAAAALAVPTFPPMLSGEVFATYINLSGRRRFTSQRVVLYAVLAAGKDPRALGVANEALTLFRDAHTSLVKGSKGAPAFISPALQDAYFGPPQGNERILAFIALAERVLHAIESGWHHQSPLLLNELIQSTTPLLAALNSITAIYETEARCHAKKVEMKLLDAMDKIKTISKHAQMVAVNARIVAARAGAAGREFSVVATELVSITTKIETVLASAMVNRT